MLANRAGEEVVLEPLNKAGRPTGEKVKVPAVPRGGRRCVIKAARLATLACHIRGNLELKRRLKGREGHDIHTVSESKPLINWKTWKEAPVDWPCMKLEH